MTDLLYSIGIVACFIVGYYIGRQHANSEDEAEPEDGVLHAYLVCQCQYEDRKPYKMYQHIIYKESAQSATDFEIACFRTLGYKPCTKEEFDAADERFKTVRNYL